MLSEHLIQTRHIGKSEAQKLIHQFRDYILTNLTKNKFCDLEPLATLLLDDNEKITVAPIKTPHPNPISETAVNENNTIETKLQSEPYNTPKINLLQENTVSDTNQNTKKPDNMNDKENNRHEESDSYDYYPYRKRSRKKVWFIVTSLVVLVAIVLYFAFLNNPNFLRQDNNHPFVSTPAVSDSLAIRDSATSVPEVYQEIESASITTPTSSGKYHIIAGVFVIEKKC
ncbi:MAG: hypothetical protein HC830_03960 [Bacteroidetes bacterium]|nr:hypothetical protein [Bacteroidota bacterium]